MKDRSQLGVARAERAPAGLISLHLEPKRKRLHYEVIGLGVLLVGILLLANLRSPSGYAGYCLGLGFSFLFGAVGSRFLAGSLTTLGVLMILRRKHLNFRRLGVGYGVLFWIGLAMLQLAVPSWMLDQPLGGQPGGLLGIALAAALRPIVGRTVGMVVLSLAALCTLGFVTDTPLIDMFSMAFRGLILTCLFIGRGLASLLSRPEPEPEPEPEPVKLSRPRRKPVEPPIVISRPEPEPEPELEPEPEPEPVRPPRRRSRIWSCSKRLKKRRAAPPPRRAGSPTSIGFRPCICSPRLRPPRAARPKITRRARRYWSGRWPATASRPVWWTLNAVPASRAMRFTCRQACG